ncbi:MAG: MarR family winged helix-turn-helix transcriptional regulator [Terracidiphilus sp.]
MNRPLQSRRGASAGRPKIVPSDRGRGFGKLDVTHLQRLAEFRFQLRRFLHVSQEAAERLGLHNQQYQMLQCVGGMPDGTLPTIANVAERMLLKHNSTVELVDRTIEQGLLRRLGDEADHRRILLRVTPQGERILATLAEFHTRELEQSGPELVRALDAIVHAARQASRQAARHATGHASGRGVTAGDRTKHRRKAAAQ